jgi:hypothetical protein
VVKRICAAGELVERVAGWLAARKNCPSKPYHPSANWALLAVIFGVIVRWDYWRTQKKFVKKTGNGFPGTD